MMKRLFLIFTVFFLSFVSLSFADAYRGICEICRENCEALGIPEGKRYCQVKFNSPLKPTASNPTCPRFSSYHTKSKRCECFSGFYAPSPTNSQCVADVSLPRLCERKFGDHIQSSEAANACFCKEGYQMVRGNCEQENSTGTIPIPRDGSAIFLKTFGTYEYEKLNVYWKVKSKILTEHGQKYAFLKWKLRKGNDQDVVRSYHIEVWNVDSGERVRYTTSGKKTRSEQFLFGSENTYKIILTAYDTHEKFLRKIIFYIHT